MVVGIGGSVLFYVTGHGEAVTQRLADFLQESDYAGVIFARPKIAGTFPLAQIHMDSAGAPDLVMTLRWSDAKNADGLAGMIVGDWQRQAGHGTHATLSRYDLHNMLVAAGPDFRRGTTDNLPTGNTDLAPTILKILCIAPPAPQDGRVLVEAMRDGGAPPKSQTSFAEAQRDLPNERHQYLKTSRVGSTIYFDEGNVGRPPR